jgi:hypothetical protein
VIKDDKIKAISPDKARQIAKMFLKTPEDLQAFEEMISKEPPVNDDERKPDSAE